MEQGTGDLQNIYLTVTSCTTNLLLTFILQDEGGDWAVNYIMSPSK